MASMSGTDPARPRRVTTAPASAHPSDEPVTIEPPWIAADGANVVVGHVGALDPDGRRPVEVVVDGWRFDLLVEDEARASLRERASRDPAAAGGAGGPLEIRAIIPGRIASVAVVPGDAVQAGQTLLAVEAMKMQNELRAPRAGTVTRVAVGSGSTVELGDVLVVLE
jgi:biotin carboxyl carrier protein